MENLARWAQILEKTTANITKDFAMPAADFVFGVVQILLDNMKSEEEKQFLVPKVLPLVKTVQPILAGDNSHITSAVAESYQNSVWKEIKSQIEEIQDGITDAVCKDFVVFINSRFFDDDDYEKMPVLFAPFVRVETATKVFKAIRKSKPKKLYVYSDGWREDKEGEKEKVEYLRKYVLENVDWDCEVFTKFEEKNRGVDSGMGTAINWFFANEEMGIVLEDDCVPAPDYFRYCSEVLTKYKGDDRVSLVLGVNKAAQKLSANSYSFKRVCDFTEDVTQLWGFATWRRMFQKYDNPLPQLEKYKNQIKAEEDTLDFDKYLKNTRAKLLIDQAELVLAGKNNAGDMILKLSMLMNDKLIIVPDCNLITNVGCGIDGSCHSTFEYAAGTYLVPGEMSFPLKHPSEVSPQPLTPKEFLRFSYTLPIFGEKEFWDMEMTKIVNIFSVHRFLVDVGLPQEERVKLLRLHLYDKLPELISVSIHYKKFHEAQKYLYLALARSFLKNENNVCSKCNTKNCLSICRTGSIFSTQAENGEVFINIDRNTCDFCFNCMKVCPLVKER